MPKEDRAEPDELERRLEIVRELVVKGMRKRHVVAYLREKHDSWGLTDRMLRNYFDMVWARLADDAANVDRPALFTWVLEGLKDLYYEARKVSDFKTAGKFLMDIVSLGQLSNPQYKMDWREAAKQAGIDPQALAAEFTETYEILQLAKQAGVKVRDVFAAYIETLDMTGVEDEATEVD